MGDPIPSWRAIPVQAITRGQQVPVAAVDAWIRRACERQIRSIICLLSEEHLQLYQSLPCSLLEYYRLNGFAVAHVRVNRQHNDLLDEPGYAGR